MHSYNRLHYGLSLSTVGCLTRFDSLLLLACLGATCRFDVRANTSSYLRHNWRTCINLLRHLNGLLHFYKHLQRNSNNNNNSEKKTLQNAANTANKLSKSSVENNSARRSTLWYSLCSFNKHFSNTKHLQCSIRGNRLVSADKRL